ncbi:putative oxalocrotonate tautomerase enzyme-domain-containing protein [Mycena capillaripes]|nr:putative oxalocrotonate tautomerase enzyme-domain-containing protein [Mycena capillaripes]
MHKLPKRPFVRSKKETREKGWQAEPNKRVALVENKHKYGSIELGHNRVMALKNPTKLPFHRFFVPKGLYSPADKAALSQAITACYTEPGVELPAFFVVVVFIELEPGNLFVGGKSTEHMVRIGVEHIARNFTSDSQKRASMDRYEAALAPFTKARGIDWEVQIVDCDRLTWNLNGLAPPDANTEEEKIWRRENRAVTPEEIAAMEAS